MLQYLIKKHKEVFPNIPIKVPIFLIAFLSVISIPIFISRDGSGLFTNIITELLGIMVTIYVVDKLFFDREKSEWKEVEKIITLKVQGFIHSFILTLTMKMKLSFKEQLELEPSYSHLEKEWDKIENILLPAIENNLLTFTGYDLEQLIGELKTVRKELNDVVTYMEKKPSYLQMLSIYILANKLERRINTYYVLNNIIKQFPIDQIVYKKEVHYIVSLQNELKYFLLELRKVDIRVSKTLSD